MFRFKKPWYCIGSLMAVLLVSFCKIGVSIIGAKNQSGGKEFLANLGPPRDLAGIRS